MAVTSILLVLSSAFFIFTVSAVDDNKLCLSVYDVSNRTIIKSTESIANGARYLGSIEKANNKQQCEYECCRVPGCNIAVYHETADRDCYFFDCGKIEDFKCIFAIHDNYIAMGMMVDRTDLDKTKIHEQSKHEMDIKLLKSNSPSPPPKSVPSYNMQQSDVQRGYPEPATAMPQRQYQPEVRSGDPYNPDYYQPAPEPEPTPQRLPQPQLSSEERSAIRQRQRSPAPPPPPAVRNPQSIMDKSVGKPQSPFGNRQNQQSAESDSQCNHWQWLCHTGAECIANYDLCDGIPQCSDKSDEDVEMCRELRRRRPDPIPNGKYRHDPWDAPGANQPQLQQPVDQRPANQARPAAPAPVQEHGLGRASSNQADSASKQVVVGNQKNPASVVTNTKTQIIALQEKTNQVTVERIESGSTSLAALILGLGMCLLAVFLVYISCRLKTARRRVKRGGKAMDSAEGDTLINGMYL